MINNSQEITINNLEELYRKVIAKLSPRNPPKGISISFYPYSRINHTIRIRNDVILVRLSDTFKEVPIEIHRALAEILTAKLFKKPVSKSTRSTYSDFVSSDAFRKTANEITKSRSRKKTGSPQGKVYNLEGIFEKVNLIYFQNSIAKPRIAWSARKTYRRLGNYNYDEDTITISRTLDSPETPKYVIEFVVFHEMLHKYHGVTRKNGRRYYHTPEFKRDEKKFSYYQEAEDWIEENAASFEAQVKGKRKRRRFLF